MLSCIVGLGMSHSAFMLRDLVTATAYTLLGTICKIATVAINYALWDKHANAIGMFFLFTWYGAKTYVILPPTSTRLLRIAVCFQVPYTNNHQNVVPISLTEGTLMKQHVDSATLHSWFA